MSIRNSKDGSTKPWFDLYDKTLANSPVIYQ